MPWRNSLDRMLGLRWLAVLLVLGSALPAEAVIPSDAIVDLRADAQVDSFPLQFDHSSHPADSNFDPIDVAAYAETDTDDGVATAYTAVTAIWDNPGQGSVVFGPTGYRADTTVPNGRVSINGTRWTYRFRTQSENQFTLTYEVDLTADTTDPSSLQGFRFVVIQNAFKPVFDQVLQAGDAGIISVPLNSNEAYTVSLIPHATITDNLGTLTAAMVGNFGWTITAEN